MDSERSNLAGDDAATDKELWLALKSGQTEALGQIYDRHAGLVYGIASKVLTTQEAEDLTQDIFIKLAQTDAYNPQRGSLRTYLAILTRSRAIDRLRSRRTGQTALKRQQADYGLMSANPPVEEMEQEEQSQEIRAALAGLSENQRQVLHMSYYEGLTQATIAEQLQTPLGTIKARARRGLLKLRQLLQDNLD
ncbi:MAG: sigma-70 family RNA polymerase sigma factor [Leptolyngbya sp. SIO4C5]|uniref:sigma-70 family RNA polymerase sigma factor n=1 Tax=Sphaerothrix gracilis TaxID=3151835 RepID=UPI0013BFFF9A|nr:sigma-70 family RNA polymerase sigma factor [Leptolyngbya sp. SIO4C5]